MGRPSPLGIAGTGVSFRDRNAKGRHTVAQVRAKDESGTWRCRRFDVTSWHRDGTPVLPDAAKEWAEDTRKSFVKGEAVARASTFQEHADLLCANLEGSVRKTRLKLIRAVSAGLQREGISDMQSDAFPSRVRHWLSHLRAGWSLPKDAKNRRLTETPLKPSSRNKLLVICRQVTGLAVLKRRLAFDPLAELPAFKVQDKIKPLFTIDELRSMVSDEARDHAIAAHADLAAAIEAIGGPRTAAIKKLAIARKVHWATIYNALARKAEADPWWLACCLLVYTGCRAQEAMHLRWEWMKWDAGVITLKLADDYQQKTDTERLIPLEPELRAILNPLARTSGHILPPEIRAGGSGVKVREKTTKTGKGGGDYTGALRRYLSRIKVAIGDRTAHSLRHSYITMKIARHDTNTDRLRKAVGHEDESTTKGYSRLSQLFEGEVDRWPDATLWLRREVPAIAKPAEPATGRVS